MTMICVICEVNKDIDLLSGDKDSSVVIMSKVDYIKKVTNMINEGI